MAQAFQLLDAVQQPNVLYAGDMNWNVKNDGEVQLPHGWYYFMLLAVHLSALQLAQREEWAVG